MAILLVKADYRTFPLSHKVQFDSTGQKKLLITWQGVGTCEMSGILGEMETLWLVNKPTPRSLKLVGMGSSFLLFLWSGIWKLRTSHTNWSRIIEILGPLAEEKAKALERLSNLGYLDLYIKNNTNCKAKGRT